MVDNSVCEHGGLRRKCEICDLRAENDRLQLEVAQQLEFRKAEMIVSQRLRGALMEISNHSVCCDARATAKEGLGYIARTAPQTTPNVDTGL